MDATAAPARGTRRRPRSFQFGSSRGDGGDDSALGRRTERMTGPKRSLPFPRSFSFGQSAKDVLTKSEQDTLDKIITEQISSNAIIKSHLVGSALSAGGGMGGGARGVGAPPGARATAWKEPPAELDEELVEYADYFGIDSVHEPHLLWIAEEGMNAPLPDGWTEHEDPDGRPYYYCKSTKTSTYEHPYDPYFKDLVARARAAYKAQKPGKPPSGPVRPKAKRVFFPVAGDAARAQASLASLSPTS